MMQSHPVCDRSAGAPDRCAKAPFASCRTIIACSVAIRSIAAHPTKFPAADRPVVHKAVSLAAMTVLQHLAQMPLSHQLVEVPLPCCGMHGLLTAQLDEQLQSRSICAVTLSLKLVLEHVRIVCSILMTWVRPLLGCPARRNMQWLPAVVASAPLPCFQSIL